MLTLLEAVQKRIDQALLKEFEGALVSSFLPAEVTQATDSRFGHYQCNTPLKLAKVLAKPPREVAEKIAICLREEISESGDNLFSKVEIAGPGFINITFDPKFLSSDLDKVLTSSHLGIPIPEKKEKVIVEFSSPNVAKELHVGHLRSTIIGESLARLLEFLGHDVLRLNHIGDWGTQFGMLIAYLKEHTPLIVSLETGGDVASLMSAYRAGKKRFDEDASFKKKAQEEVVALQKGETQSLSLWKKICEVSRASFEEIYELLDVHLVERGESFYNKKLPVIVDFFEKKGLITLSDGAKCIFLEGFLTKEGTPLPLIIQKKDGGYNYSTTDLASLYHRIEKEKADRIIYVTDNGQKTHFSMFFEAAKKGGFYNPKKVHVEHVTFGLVLGKDGKKFKTRSGDTEKLIDLLNESIARAYSIMKERLPEEKEETLQTLAKKLGIGAVKYADLSSLRTKDYQFSYEKMLKFEGNTVAFLFYAYVRIEGIKRKIGNLDRKGEIKLEHPSEIALGLHLRQFGEALLAMDRDLLPNRLTDYLYHLAEKFHHFFRDCRVEGSDEETSRLLLSLLTSKVLKTGLHLLGIEVMDRM